MPAHECVSERAATKIAFFVLALSDRESVACRGRRQELCVVARGRWQYSNCWPRRSVAIIQDCLTSTGRNSNVPSWSSRKSDLETIRRRYSLPSTRSEPVRLSRIRYSGSDRLSLFLCGWGFALWGVLAYLVTGDDSGFCPSWGCCRLLLLQLFSFSMSMWITEPSSSASGLQERARAVASIRAVPACRTIHFAGTVVGARRG